MRIFCFSLFFLSFEAFCLEFSLPTANAFIKEEPQKFYSPTLRRFEKKEFLSWQGGQYGYCRNLKRISKDKIIASRFHEGIDIQPLISKKQRYLDIVYPISKGKIVYLNSNPENSNYGKYVVVKHIWKGMPFYSLYAHFSEIHQKIGTRIGKEDSLGRIGYTGKGITKNRAHLHLELCLLLSEKLDGISHGIYNGKNLIGLPVQELFLDKRKSPLDFWKNLKTYYTILIPKKKKVPEIVQRYPFLLKRNIASDFSWKISLSSSGIPLFFESTSKKVSSPQIDFIQYSQYHYSDRTRGYIRGTKGRAKITQKGEKYFSKLAI